MLRSIIDFGAVPDGRTNCAAAIQAAVDAAAGDGGGTVLIPAGRWLSGSVLLKSHVTLQLETGACLVVDSGNSTFRIPFSRILYIEALDKKLTIWTKQQSISIRMTLNTLETTLPPELFFRCHRSYIINVKAIESVDFTAMEVTLTSGDTLPLSRTARDGMREVLEQERKQSHAD